MKKKLLFVAAALSIAVLFSSCGKAPQAEIDAASAAIDSAKIVGADVYVAEDFSALQDSMLSVAQNIETQKSKLFANYGQIKEQLAQVTELAYAVKAKSEARKEEVKLEIASLYAEVTALQTQNNELVTKAPKGKEGAAALESIKSDALLIDTSLQEVNTFVSNDDLVSGLDKVKAAKEKATSINTELNGVVGKYAKAKK